MVMKNKTVVYFISPYQEKKVIEPSDYWTELQDLKMITKENQVPLKQSKHYIFTMFSETQNKCHSLFLTRV